MDRDRDQNNKLVPGKPGTKVKDILRDRDRARDNPDGEEIQRGIIEEARRQIVQRQQLEDNVDAEESNGRRHRHQHGSQSTRRPQSGNNHRDHDLSAGGGSLGGRRHVHGQLSFADENSVDREERQSHHERRRRRSSVSPEEQFERWRWIRECRDGLISFFIEPFQSGRHSRHRRKWYDYTKDELRQQKLPVLWEPIWNCRSVGRLLLYLSILTMPLAAILFVTNAQTTEFRFTFGEECKNARNYLRLIRSMCTFCGGNLNPNCHKVIEIPEDVRLPVYLYYELEGFHQNHRKLTRAMDSDQLIGNIFDGNFNPRKPKNCGEYTEDDKGKIYFPCGALANLMFNDDFALKTPGGEEVPLRTHGIAFSGLKYHRFRNPPSEIVNQKDYHLRSVFKDNFVKPKDWTTETWDDWWSLGGNENERFINWMNPSAFSHMRKLYAVIDSVPMCPIGLLCKGNYTMNIEYRYDVDRFEGNKAFILAITSWFGGRNLIIPYVVAVVAGLEFALGLLMLQLHRRYGNIDQDHCNFSNAEISTVSSNRSGRSSRSRNSHNYPQQTQQLPKFTDKSRPHAPPHRYDNEDKPIITKFKRASETPVSPTKYNPNSKRPPEAAVAEQSFETILDMDISSSAAVFKTAVQSSTIDNQPASSTAEGGVARKHKRPHTEQQRPRNDARGGGGEQECSLLYLTENPTSFQRESVFIFPDAPPRRHGGENVSLNDTTWSTTANDTDPDTEDERNLTTTASSAVSDVVSDAESIVSYWSNGTMITADESSSEADEGDGGRREGMIRGGANSSVPRKRRLQ